MRLMEARVAEWGDQKWGSYSQGNNGDVAAAVHTYYSVNGAGNLRTSCATGCGGWATYLSDAAFGSTGFPMRKVTSVDNIRTGDIMLDLSDGKISHISIVSGKTNVQDFVTYIKTNYGVYTANDNTVPGHSANAIDPTCPSATTNYDSTTGYSYVFYTRYPD